MAASAGMTPLPPSVIHTTTRLTHSQAHTHLSTFLELAENDAAYRPDSTLTDRGPQALSSGSTPNLTLAHLRRIRLGMEGKRVGGGIKLAGQEDDSKQVAEAGNENEEVFPAEELANEEIATSPQETVKKTNKRAFDSDDNVEEGAQASKSKKQKKYQKIISTSGGAERGGDPTDEAILSTNQEPADSEEWQDPTLYALAQDQMNTNDSTRANDQIAANGGAEDADYEDSNANNEVEEARNPSANLKQPHSKKEEKDLLKIRVSKTGEMVDPQDAARDRVAETSKDKDKNKDKDKKRKDKETKQSAEAESTPSTAVEQSPKKKKKQTHTDHEGDVNMAMQSSPPAPDPALPPPPRSSQASKIPEHDEGSAYRSLSKDERKRLKKMRSQGSKRDREEVRLKKKELEETKEERVKKEKRKSK